MARHSVCFRFDVDTPCCLTAGVPALLDLAEELDVRFTFFVNPGRAVSLPSLLRGHGARESAPKLSGRRKLGWRQYLYTALRNPPLGRLDRAGHIARAVAGGHDVGLHGGRNHAQWQRRAHTWNEATVRDELDYGIRTLKDLGVDDITSFASPGWNTPPGLEHILPDYGIRVLADLHGPCCDAVVQAANEEVAHVPTNLLGEPGGVGYLEWRTAQRLDVEDVLGLFAEQFRIGDKDCYVVYDHPCFAGLEGLPLLRRLIEFCRACHFEITTVSELARTH